MKSFKQFLNEETMPYATNARGIIDVDDSSVRDGLNSQLAGVTAGKFVTPYIALERVSKALANYHIFIPRHSFLEGDSGMLVWPINQFGIKFGQQNDGTFVQNGEVLKDTSKGIHPEGEDNKVVSEPNREPEKPFSVFFEYRQSDCGMFNIFCEVVSQEELDDILADLEDEMNEDDEELNEEAVDEACWKGYRKKGMKTMFGKRYPNCVKVEEENLEEVSKEFVRTKYLPKARPQLAQAKSAVFTTRNPQTQEKLMKLIKRRSRGVSRAENKLTKDVMAKFDQDIKTTFSPENVAKMFAAQKKSREEDPGFIKWNAKKEK